MEMLLLLTAPVNVTGPCVMTGAVVLVTPLPPSMVSVPVVKVLSASSTCS